MPGLPDPDPPLCGDPTCQGPGCRQSSIDAWDRRMEEEAKAILRHALVEISDFEKRVLGHPELVTRFDEADPSHSWEYVDLDAWG